MEITIRKAEERDMPGLMRLLSEVLELHARIRPDIFISGTTKYTPEELRSILRDENTPVFAAVDEAGRGCGLCVLHSQAAAFFYQYAGFSDIIH